MEEKYFVYQVKLGSGSATQKGIVNGRSSRCICKRPDSSYEWEEDTVMFVRDDGYMYDYKTYNHTQEPAEAE